MSVALSVCGTRSQFITRKQRATHSLSKIFDYIFGALPVSVRRRSNRWTEHIHSFILLRIGFDEMRFVANFMSQVSDYKHHSAIRVYLLIYFCAAASTGNKSFIIKLICPMLLLQPKSLAKSDSVFCTRPPCPLHPPPSSPKDIFNYSFSRFGLIKMSN